MTFKKFLNAFPPPKFLNIPFAGVALSDTSVRCIQFEKDDAGLHIAKYREEMLPAGAVTAGQINQPEEITKILRKFKDELHLNHVKISLPEEKAYLFTMNIPTVPNADVRSAIEFKIEENVPLPASELVFDYVLIDPDPAQDHLRVVVSALPNTTIDTYMQIAHDAELSLLSLEIGSQAVARAILPAGHTGSTLIMHFGHEKVGLYVAHAGVVHFTSTVAIKIVGGDISSFLSRETEKLFTYWHTLTENAGKDACRIKNILICGEDFSADVLPYISGHNTVTVAYGNVWTNVFDINTTVPTISFSDSLKYAPAIGLALPSEVLI